MSFTSDVKNDLLSVKNNDLKSKLEAEAILRLSSEISIFGNFKIEVSSNNLFVIRRLASLLKQNYEFSSEVISRVINRFNKQKSYSLIITDGAKDIITDLNLINDGSKYKEAMEVEDYGDYLRGSFLAKGSVNDPKNKNHHLEISSTNDSEIIFLQRIMNELDLNGRITKRNGYLVLYIKSQSNIGEFLYRIGASSIMEYYENTVITNEIKASAKRTINLDIANQAKTNDAAKDHFKSIAIIEKYYDINKLDAKIIQTITVRKEHPEDSLTELLDVIHDEYDPYLTKSGLNHRFRKIKLMAQEIIDNKQ